MFRVSIKIDDKAGILDQFIFVGWLTSDGWGFYSKKHETPELFKIFAEHDIMAVSDSLTKMFESFRRKDYKGEFPTRDILIQGCDKP